jgi:hypothetical protein
LGYSLKTNLRCFYYYYCCCCEAVVPTRLFKKKNATWNSLFNYLKREKEYYLFIIYLTIILSGGLSSYTFYIGRRFTWPSANDCLPSLFFILLQWIWGCLLCLVADEDVGCLNTFKYIKIIFFYILKKLIFISTYQYQNNLEI